MKNNKFLKVRKLNKTRKKQHKKKKIYLSLILISLAAMYALVYGTKFMACITYNQF